MVRRDVVVTGGGTSGHVIPALAVLESLEDAGVASSALAYVGCRRGVERALLVDTPFDARFLPIAGFQRSLSLRSIVRNLTLPLRIFVSYPHAVLLALRWRPRVVVSVGGYASAPMAFASRVMRIPLVCVTYDAVPGLATRRQARHATLCAAAFPDSRLPNSVHTGAPVRRAILSIDVPRERTGARRELGLPVDAVLVTVVGGSQGSAVLNSSVPDIVDALSTCGRSVAVLHVCGERFLDSKPVEPPTHVHYTRVGYESRMRQVLAATDVFVCRAGAGTIAELSTVGVASVIVPWKDSADDHQRVNASWMSEGGAAIVIEENESTSVEVSRAVRELVCDDRHRETVTRAARERGESNRSGALSSAILDVLRRGSPHKA